MKPLPDAIRELRGSRSQERFAGIVGVTRLTVASWERADNPSEPEVDNLRALVREGLDVRYLLGDDAQAAQTGGEAA